MPLGLEDLIWDLILVGFYLDREVYYFIIFKKHFLLSIQALFFKKSMRIFICIKKFVSVNRNEDTRKK